MCIGQLQPQHAALPEQQRGHTQKRTLRVHPDMHTCIHAHRAKHEDTCMHAHCAQHEHACMHACAHLCAWKHCVCDTPQLPNAPLMGATKVRSRMWASCWCSFQGVRLMRLRAAAAVCVCVCLCARVCVRARAAGGALPTRKALPTPSTWQAPHTGGHHAGQSGRSQRPGQQVDCGRAAARPTPSRWTVARLLASLRLSSPCHHSVTSPPLPPGTLLPTLRMLAPTR